MRFADPLRVYALLPFAALLVAYSGFTAAGTDNIEAFFDTLYCFGAAGLTSGLLILLRLLSATSGERRPGLGPLPALAAISFAATCCAAAIGLATVEIFSRPFDFNGLRYGLSGLVLLGLLAAIAVDSAFVGVGAFSLPWYHAVPASGLRTLIGAYVFYYCPFPALLLLALACGVALYGAFGKGCALWPPST